ncbi:MAG: 30S ribosomal protein S27e [Candidatus Aenigmatarchaeota archaeon]|nr:30S ribosomal protein S27e [Candidatus Aenigmarchaeota archaeon]
MAGKFLRVICLKCRNEQIIFEKASTIVKCLNCGQIIAKPTGGKAKLEKVEVIEEIE